MNDLNTRGIVLVGPMGAGKTAIGRRLAKKLIWDFADTDQDIQERTGVDIPFIFEKEGEEGFRRRETRSLLALLDKPGCVIATGGGAILADENREALKKHGLVVFLAASVETQLRRTKRGRHRPLLDQPDPEAILRELYMRRLPLYREVADIEIDTDGQHVEEVAKRLLQRLREEHEVLFDA